MKGVRPSQDATFNYRLLRSVLRSYDSWITKAYLLVRFATIRWIMVDILSNLPRSGVVLNLGSGIGLFDIYCAFHRPDLSFIGIDLNARRVTVSNEAARRMGVPNVTFRQGDVGSCLPEVRPAVVIALDLLHHIDPATRTRVLTWIADHLAPGGLLFVKDISTHKRWKVRFTKMLDDLMTGGSPVYYFGVGEMQRQLHALGFATITFHLWDYVPFPHIIYVATRRPER